MSVGKDFASILKGAVIVGVARSDDQFLSQGAGL
jgi:hypothetical protein